MTGENSPNYACGQILFCLKVSKLNYVVKETPYSAYVTIRKKFIRTEDDSHQTVHDNTKMCDNETELLKEKNKDLETKLALARVEFEEKEIYKENLLTKLSERETEIENFLKNEKSLNEQINQAKKENNELRKAFDEVFNDKEGLEDKNANLEKEKNDLDDRIEELFREITYYKEELSIYVSKTKSLESNIVKKEKEIHSLSDKNVILENTLSNKVEEIETLKEEINCARNLSEHLEETNEKYDDTAKHKMDFQNHDPPDHREEDTPSTSKCGICDYGSDEEYEMKMHMKSSHEFACMECEYISNKKSDLKEHIETSHTVECQKCNEMFAGIEKLNGHICRVHIKNPRYKDYYMKDWLIRNDCIRVFSRKKQCEVGILHSELCLESKSCPDLPPKLQTDTDRVVGENFFVHVPVSKFFSNGEIKWNILYLNLID